MMNLISGDRRGQATGNTLGWTLMAPFLAVVFMVSLNAYKLAVQALPAEQQAVAAQIESLLIALFAAAVAFVIVMAVIVGLAKKAEQKRVYHRLAFGRQRMVGTEDVTGGMPRKCVNCWNTVYHYEEREFRTDITVFGLVLRNIEHGTTRECRECQEADGLEYFERADMEAAA